MEENRIPKPGEIYKHFKDKQYQIITIATHSENRELMVVYQALYGDFKTYVRPLNMFLSEVDHIKYPDVKQKYRFERKSSFVDILYSSQATTDVNIAIDLAKEAGNETIQSGVELKNRPEAVDMGNSQRFDSTLEIDDEQEVTGEVNSILMEFLDETTYSKKLEILLLNKKHLNDRLVNDMAIALDIAVDEGPLETRIQGLINCLSALSRFEHRRLR